MNSVTIRPALQQLLLMTDGSEADDCMLALSSSEKRTCLFYLCLISLWQQTPGTWWWLSLITHR